MDLLLKNKPFIYALAYMLLFYAIYIILFHLGAVTAGYTDVNLMNRDAEWYWSIVQNGYVFEEGKQSNTAFSPLFSFVWKYTRLSNLGISFLNLSIYMSAVYLIIRFFKLKTIEVLMLISTPTLVFCFVPYSEALFFISTTVMLIALKLNKPWWVLIACIMAGYARSVIVFFIPASIILLLFYYKTEYRKSIIAVILGSIIAFVTIQIMLFFETGRWDSFFESQKQWGNGFVIPHIPFSSWRRETLWEDLQAMVISLGLCFTVLFYIIKKSKDINYSLPKPYVMFSMLYLGGMGLFVMLFRGGDFHSLNRFIFATPFFWMIALALKDIILKPKAMYWLATLFVIFLFSSNGILANEVDVTKSIIYCIAIFLLFTRWIYWFYVDVPKWFTLTLVLIGFAFQIHLLHTYLSGNGIG